MRGLIVALLGLTALPAWAQGPAPFVQVWVEEHTSEPSQGATPSTVGRVLSEFEWIEAEAVLVGTPGGSSERACESITTDVAGRIAVIRRGDCSTQAKASHAAAAGALAALIYNDVEPAGPGDTTIVWQDGGDSPVVSIPVALTRAVTGELLRSLAPVSVEYSGSGGCFDYNGIADPTPPSDYYPLAAGNAWEYMAWIYPSTYRQRLDVVGDTLVEGIQHFVLRDARYATSDPTVPTSVTTNLVRFDPVTASVGGSCPLDTPFEAGSHECFAGGSPGMKSFGSCYQGIGDGGEWVHTYEAGRGLIRSVLYSMGQPTVQPIEIVYSRVNGVEVGTPVVWPVAAGEPVERVAAALVVVPNPAARTLTVSFTLDLAQDAVVEVVDTVGRVVATQDLGGRPAGAGAVLLDVSALASGRYTVRLTGDGDLRLSAPLVIAR